MDNNLYHFLVSLELVWFDYQLTSISVAEKLLPLIINQVYRLKRSGSTAGLLLSRKLLNLGTQRMSFRTSFLSIAAAFLFSSMHLLTQNR